MKNITPAFIIVILLTLITQRIAYNRIVYPIADWRITNQELIVTGHSIPPYQYRIAKPFTGEILQNLLKPIIPDLHERHLLSYKIMLYVAFFFIYLLFYIFLRNYYDELLSIAGITLLAIFIPLSINIHWQEGDFLTLALYLLAFVLMHKGKDHWIPLIILFGTFNREQTIFILVFYVCYLLANKKLFTKRSILIIATSIALFVSVYFSIRTYYGFRYNMFTVEHHIRENIANWKSITRFWIEMVLILAIFSIKYFKKNELFLKYAFIALIPYTIFFFLFGIMGEMAKFLPAHLIMITMFLKLEKRTEEQGEMIARQAH